MTIIMSTYKHINNLEVRAEFSKDNKFRYKLEAIKTNGKDSDRKIICVIMQNPSEANENIADKSVQFIEKLIFNKGYKEFENVHKIIVVNRFAYVQKKDFKGGGSAIGPKNDKSIESAINESNIILIAWGKSNRYKERQEAVNRMLFLTSNKKMYKTKKHPSRGFYNNFISDYIP